MTFIYFALYFVIKGFARSLANEVDTWGEEWHMYAVKLRHLADDIMNRIKGATIRQDSGFNVLNHGDLWINNLMFKNRTDEIRFLDFQLTHYSSPAIDLHYFITTSANVEVRRNHRDHLIQVNIDINLIFIAVNPSQTFLLKLFS